MQEADHYICEPSLKTIAFIDLVTILSTAFATKVDQMLNIELLHLI